MNNHRRKTLKNKKFKITEQVAIKKQTLNNSNTVSFK